LSGIEPFSSQFVIAGSIAIVQAVQGPLSVVERALEIAALRLGSNKSRGYSLEMIRADFLAGAALETDNSIQDPKCSASIGCSAAVSRRILQKKRDE
jgi:hypothetical protein